MMRPGKAYPDGRVELSALEDAAMLMETYWKCVCWVLALASGTVQIVHR